MSTTYTQLPIVIETALDVPHGSIQSIEADIERIAPSVRITASQMTDSGYTILIEGEIEPVYRIYNYWQSGQ